MSDGKTTESARKRAKNGSLEVVAIESEKGVAKICEQAIIELQEIVKKRIDDGKEPALAGRGLVNLEKTISGYYQEMGIKIGKSFRDRLSVAMRDAFDEAKNDIATQEHKSIYGKVDSKQINNAMKSTYAYIAGRTTKMSADHIAHLRSVSADVFRRASVTGKSVQEVTKELKERAMEVPGFKFVGKNGATWSNEAYFKMLARTELMNAGRNVYDNTCAENGYDIVRLDYSGGACEKCSAFEGKIFSLTGATKGIPSKQDLINAGVFHPNCTHSYTALTDFELYELGYDVQNPATEDKPIEETKPIALDEKEAERLAEEERKRKEEEALAKEEEEKKREAEKFDREVREINGMFTRGNLYYLKSLSTSEEEKARESLQEYAKVVAEDRKRGIDYKMDLKLARSGGSYQLEGEVVISGVGKSDEKSIWHSDIGTFKHETGHAIHYNYFKKHGSKAVDEITKAGHSDFRVFWEKNAKDFDTFNFSAEGYWNPQDWGAMKFFGTPSYRELPLEKRRHVISVLDALQSISDGKFGCGHSAGYHKKLYSYGGSYRYAEAIADIREVMLGSNDDVKAFIRENFPQMVAFSEKIGTIPKQEEK